MAISTAGIRSLIIAKGNTIAPAATEYIAVGIRNGAELKITPLKTIEDYRGRSFRNLMNFKMEVEGLQYNMLMLKNLISFLNLNASVQMVSAPQGGTPDVFLFDGSANSFLLGMGFEFEITGDKRTLKLIIEGAAEFDRAKTLIDAADTTTPIAITAMTNNDGSDAALVKSPYFSAIEYPKGTSIISAPDIVDRKLNIKTVGKKNIYNCDLIDYLEITIELTGREASIAKLIAMMSKGVADSFYWKEKNTGTFFDAFDIAANYVTLKDEFTINNDDRTYKAILGGRVPVGDISFLFGAANGGDATDTTGLKGGTMKIG